jgi:hypothetical protein
VVLSNIEDKNKYSFKVDSSGGLLLNDNIWETYLFDIVNLKSIYLEVSGSVQFFWPEK